MEAEIIEQKLHKVEKYKVHSKIRNNMTPKVNIILTYKATERTKLNKD